MSERKLSKKRWGSASGSPVEFKFLIDRSIQTRGSFIFIWFVAYCWLHDFDARISIEFATCWFIYRIWQSPLCHANFAHHTFWQRPDATIAQRETLQFSIPQFFLFFFFFFFFLIIRLFFFRGWTFSLGDKTRNTKYLSDPFCGRWECYVNSIQLVWIFSPFRFNWRE